MQFSVYCCSDLPHIDGSVQDCLNSSALVMVLLQSCTEPSIWNMPRKNFKQIDCVWKIHVTLPWVTKHEINLYNEMLFRMYCLPLNKLICKLDRMWNKFSLLCKYIFIITTGVCHYRSISVCFIFIFLSRIVFELNEVLGTSIYFRRDPCSFYYIIP